MQETTTGIRIAEIASVMMAGGTKHRRGKERERERMYPIDL